MTRSWIAVVQREDGTEETEILTLDGPDTAQIGPGSVFELTDGRRITLVEPATEAA